MSALIDEIAETQSLLSSATHSGVKGVLQTHLAKLQKQQAAETQTNSSSSATAAVTPTVSSAALPSKTVALASNAAYVPIESFAWDQGQYNSPTVSIFVDLDNVGDAKDRVTVNFSKTSFDLQVIDLNGKNYRLWKDNLEKDIVPGESSFIVKKNKVVIKLKKVKGEYSYDHWTALTSKKKRDEASADAKKDPSAGIMDMMKNMYDEGDENMKRIIGEAMMKSQRGEKPSAPDAGFGDLGDI